MKTDIQIAQECQMEHISKIAEKAHIDAKYIEQYGNYKAKIDLALLDETKREDGKLVLEKKGTDQYYKLLKLFHNYLEICKKKFKNSKTYDII